MHAAVKYHRGFGYEDPWCNWAILKGGREE
jgi:hypothetical protein